MNPEDDARLSKLLKASPPMEPPESFYRGVIEKIERKRAVVPWYFGYPMKGLATACVLVMLVVVTRETRRTKPKLFAVLQTEDQEALNAKKPLSTPASPPNSLADTKEVQDRLARPISNMVGNPSPFEELDEQTRQDLNLRGEDSEANAPRAAAPIQAKGDALKINLGERRKAVVGGNVQAPDTVAGAATQGSFLAREEVPARSRASAQNDAAPYGKIQTAPKAALAKSARLSLAYGVKEEPGGASPSWKGTTSGISTFRTVLIRTPAAWISLWREHSAGQASAVPEVDFEQFMVIGVFAGTKPTAGDAVEIVDVQTRPDQLIVSYRETHPPAGMAGAAVLTQPYHLRIIPRTNLPITFQKEP